MSAYKTIPEYLDAVAQQIRWKRARPVVISELAHHLEDQRDAFTAQGCEDAEQLAVEEMGDPISVGMELDGIHRPKPQWGLLILTMALALSGAFVRMYLSSDANPLYTMLSLGLGCAALLLGYFLDDTRLARHGRLVYMGVLMVSVVITMGSPLVNGAAFYYPRFVILCFPVAYAFWLYTFRGKGWMGILFASMGGFPLAIICMRVPDAFGLGLFLLTGFTLFITATWNDWFGIGRKKSMVLGILCMVIAAAVLCGGVTFLANHTNRLEILFAPERDAFGRGYIALQIRQFLEASKFLGVGDTIYTTPLEWSLPGRNHEAFLTTLIYQLGWLPFFAVVLVFAALVVCLLYRCLQHRTQWGKLLAVAVILTLCVEAFSSISWNLGFTLANAAFPLVMDDGYTVLNLWLIGLALSIFRGERIAQDPPIQLQPQYH